ncbi:multidrug effflux MFS transporter [Celeribacter sp. ULVN23_4]
MSPSQSQRGKALPTITILTLALLSAVAPFATDMYLPGFLNMASDLDVGAATIQGTLTAFLLGLASGQLVIGALSDRFGRRRPLILGTVLAIVSSLLIVVAPNATLIIILRALQGLGGAAGVVLARAVISDRTESAAASARLFQIMMIIGGLAPVVAPLAGTLIVSTTGWRTVFIVTGILSVISLVGVLKTVPESLPVEDRRPGGMAALGRGIAEVLQNGAYVGYTLTVSFAFMVLFGYISASPFVFQGILGLSTVAYPVAFGANAIGIAVVSAISTKLVGRVSPRQLTLYGLILLLVGGALTLICVLSGAGAMFMLPALFITIASLGLVLGNASALAIGQVPQLAGTGSALLGALQFTLGAIASPLVGLAGKDSALPMALVLLVAAGLASVSFTFLTRQDALRMPAE